MAFKKSSNTASCPWRVYSGAILTREGIIPQMPLHSRLFKNRISSFVTGAVKYGEMPYQDFRWQQHTSLPKM